MSADEETKKFSGIDVRLRFVIGTSMKVKFFCFMMGVVFVYLFGFCYFVFFFFPVV